MNYALDNDSLDSHCISINRPWSIIDSSASNAHLAAVLAGFMVTAIVFLLRRDDASDKISAAAQAAKTHTVVMFYAGVAVLALDSYLFGSVAAMRPPSTSNNDGEVVRSGAENICAMAWSQGMAASGMLAVGGVLLVAGLAWATNQFARNANSASWFLAALGNFMTFVVISTVLILLQQTSSDYIETLASPPFKHSLHDWVTPLWMVTVSVIVLCLILIGTRICMLCKPIKDKKPWPAESHTRGKIRSLNFALIGTAALTLVGPIFEPFWFAHQRPSTTSMVCAMFLCQILPSAIFIAIAYSVPGPEFCWETLADAQLPTTQDDTANRPTTPHSSDPNNPPVTSASPRSKRLRFIGFVSSDRQFPE